MAQLSLDLCPFSTDPLRAFHGVPYPVSHQATPPSVGLNASRNTGYSQQSTVLVSLSVRGFQYAVLIEEGRRFVFFGSFLAEMVDERVEFDVLLFAFLAVADRDGTGFGLVTTDN